MDGSDDELERRTNTPAREKPSEITCGHGIVQETERGPPMWNSRIGNYGAMHKIEHAVCTQRNHDHPKRRPKPEYCDCEEGAADQRLENQRTG